MEKIDFPYFIERYNAGEMNDAEKQWFHKELEGNEKLISEVNLRKNIDKTLKNKDILSLRNKLLAIEKRRKAKVFLSKMKRPVYKYATAIACLVLIGGITMFPGKKLSNDKIISKYNKVYEPPTSQRSGLSVTNFDFSLAMDFYEGQNYKKASSLFEKMLVNNPKDMQVQLLNGVANFELKKYSEAKQAFMNVINDNNNLFIETAEWYLAMCYISADDRNMAVKQLEIIKSEGGIYGDDAKKIISNLK